MIEFRWLNSAIKTGFSSRIWKISHEIYRPLRIEQRFVDGWMALQATNFRSFSIKSFDWIVELYLVIIAVRYPSYNGFIEACGLVWFIAFALLKIWLFWLFMMKSLRIFWLILSCSIGLKCGLVLDVDFGVEQLLLLGIGWDFDSCLKANEFSNWLANENSWGALR